MTGSQIHAPPLNLMQMRVVVASLMVVIVGTPAVDYETPICWKPEQDVRSLAHGFLSLAREALVASPSLIMLLCELGLAYFPCRVSTMHLQKMQ